MQINEDLKFVAFDLDGTLVEERSSWLTLHRHYATENLATGFLRLYEEGRIDYNEFMRKDIQLWPRANISEISRILIKNATLRRGARKVVSTLRERGYEIGIVSTGIDLLVKNVASRVGIDITLANGLETDSDGLLTGHGILRVDLLKKDIALRRMLRERGYALNQCIAVGDSRYDVRFLKAAGLGIAVGGDEKAKKAADFVVSELAEILDYL